MIKEPTVKIELTEVEARWLHDHLVAQLGWDNDRENVAVRIKLKLEGAED